MLQYLWPNENNANEHDGIRFWADEVQRLAAIQHINLLATKIMDHKKYQQDLLSIEVGHAKVRNEIAAIIFFIWKGDSDGIPHELICSHFFCSSV